MRVDIESIERFGDILNSEQQKSRLVGIEIYNMECINCHQNMKPRYYKCQMWEPGKNTLNRTAAKK